MRPKGVLHLLGSRVRRSEPNANSKDASIGLTRRAKAFEVTLSEEVAKVSKHPSVVLRGDADSIEVLLFLYLGQPLKVFTLNLKAWKFEG